MPDGEVQLKRQLKQVIFFFGFAVACSTIKSFDILTESSLLVLEIC